MDHFGAGVSLLMSTGQRNGIELADRIITTQNTARVFPGNRRTGFRLGPRHLAVFPFAQRPLGHKVQNAARVVVAREPVLYGGIFYFSIFMDDDFHYRGVELITVAYGRGAAFDITHIAAFIRHQNRALKLTGFLGVNAKIGG